MRERADECHHFGATKKSARCVPTNLSCYILFFHLMPPEAQAFLWEAIGFRKGSLPCMQPAVAEVCPWAYQRQRAAQTMFYGYCNDKVRRLPFCQSLGH